VNLLAFKAIKTLRIKKKTSSKYIKIRSKSSFFLILAQFIKVILEPIDVLYM